jgi:uncharacterized membrane protein YhhN
MDRPGDRFYDAKMAQLSATRRTPDRATGSLLARVVLGLFIVVAAARLAAIPLELGALARGSTWLLMPSLALWVLVRRGPVLVVAALLFSAAGDVLLGLDGWFLAGMGAFAVAHIGYVTQFVRSRALPALRRRWVLVVVYAGVLGGLVVWLWPHLGDLRLPVLGYALLLAATALTSAALGWWLGLGGALFFVSDAMIAAWDIAVRPAPPLPGLWIMSTYILAQYLLAREAMGVTRRGADTDSYV